MCNKLPQILLYKITIYQVTDSVGHTGHSEDGLSLFHDELGLQLEDWKVGAEITQSSLPHIFSGCFLRPQLGMSAISLILPLCCLGLSHSIEVSFQRRPSQERQPGRSCLLHMIQPHHTVSTGWSGCKLTQVQGEEKQIVPLDGQQQDSRKAYMKILLQTFLEKVICHTFLNH